MTPKPRHPSGRRWPWRWPGQTQGWSSTEASSGRRRCHSRCSRTSSCCPQSARHPAATGLPRPPQEGTSGFMAAIPQVAELGSWAGKALSEVEGWGVSCRASPTEHPPEHPSERPPRVPPRAPPRARPPRATPQSKAPLGWPRGPCSAPAPGPERPFPFPRGGQGLGRGQAALACVLLSW